MRRDLKHDLKLCKKATPGPWSARSWSIPTDDQFFVQQLNGDYPKEIATVWQGARYLDGPEITPEEAKNNAIFIAEARQGWPHAIIRALFAESKVQNLQAEIAELKRQLAELLKEV